MATAPRLLTAEEFGRLPDDGRLMELVRGEVVEVNLPYPRHGQICSNINHRIGSFVEERQLGRTIINSGVITERDPDTVRGADIAFYSYIHIPPGRLPWGYLPVAPEFVFAVRSPTDPWPCILRKVAEYLDAGVSVVGVADDSTERVYVYRVDENLVLTADEELTLPELHADFRAVIRQFFE
jgi:Uma2 family endonuclease